jgi:translocation and assembly module TamB
MDNIVADLVMDGEKLTINTLTARSGGPLAVTGSIGLAKLSEPVFDLGLSGETVYLLNNEQGRLRAESIDLTMRGPLNATSIAGSVRILDGVLYVDDYSQKDVLPAWDPLFLSMLDTSNVGARDLYTAPNTFMDNLNVGINLEVGRDTWVRTPDANVELYSVGPLRVLMQRPGRALSMEGVLSTDRGQYTFRSKRFEIRRGSATFPASSLGLNPTLQIVGEHEIQLPSSGTANISVVIRGTMRQPEISLESDTQPPLSQTDMMSYLAFGRSSGSLLSGASGLAPSGGGVQGVGKVAGQQLAGVALGAILNEAQREAEGAGMRSLGLDLLNISPAETYTEIAKGDILSFLRQTEFEAGRYVTPRTFVAGQLRLSATPGLRAVHRSPGGYIISTSWEPRILLREPTLREQRSLTKRAFSLFFSREWRF